MISADGSFVTVFNGEIYNHPELRRALEREGAVFRTTSDTEVLLHLYARYGADMVHHLRGMFAFGIWDAQRRGLFSRVTRTVSNRFIRLATVGPFALLHKSGRCSPAVVYRGTRTQLGS